MESVVYNEQHGGFWEIRDHAGVCEAASDWALFTSAVVGHVPIPHEEAYRWFPQLPLESDRPEHTAYRRLIASFFGQGSVASIESDVRAVVSHRVRRMKRRGTAEIVEGFALPIVLFSLATLLDRPVSDVRRWLAWGKEPTLTPWSAADMIDYISEAIEESRDDFFGFLGSCMREGRLSRDEALGFGHAVLAAGRGTTVDSITNAIWYLGTHGSVQAQLRADPSLIPAAVEESLRLMSPLDYIGRVVTRDATCPGASLREGDAVALHFASANRDPSVFENPDEFVLDRSPNRHLAFGVGPHRCIGAHLARSQVRIVLEEVLSGVPQFSIADGDAVPRNADPAQTNPGFETLRVRLA